mgnify:CR=1 FL=1
MYTTVEGNIRYTMIECKSCDGRGYTWSVGCGDGSRTCNVCDGMGDIITETIVDRSASK